MSGGDFKKNLLKYGYINYDTKNMVFPGSIEANSITAQSFVGNVVAVLPSTANIDIVGNVVGNLVSTNVVTANTITANLIGNGSLLSGVTSTLPANANIDIIGNVTAPGNIVVSGQVNVVGNVLGNYFFGNGALLEGILTSLPSTANINIVGNVTAPGNIIVSGQVNAVGNVVGAYFRGNGALLRGVLTSLPTTANINIVGNVTAPGNIIVTGQVTAIGNVTSSYFRGNGALLQGILTTFPSSANINIVGNVTAPGNVVVAGQVNVVGNVVTPYFIGNGALLRNVLTSLPSIANIDIVGNVTAPGNFIVSGQVNVVGNVTSAYMFGNGTFLQNVLTTLPEIANINITGNVTAPGNIIVNGQVNVVGNVVTPYFIGNGSSLSNVVISMPTIANIDIVGNVTAPGNVIVLGQVNVVGNAAGAYLFGNGAFLSNVSASLPSTANTNLIGNVISPGNIVVNGQVLVNSLTAADFYFGNGAFLTNVINTIVGVKNLDIVGNVLASGNISALGQVNFLTTAFARYFIGNGAFVSNASTTFPRNANLDIVGNVSAPGNVTVSGQVNVVGNVVGGYFIGNGALLRDVVSSLPQQIRADVIGNVTAPGNVNVTGQVNVIGNTAADYFFGNGALLTGVFTQLPAIVNLTVSGNVISSFANVQNVTVLIGNIGNVGNVILENGNVTAAYLIGNGALLTNILKTFPTTGNIDIFGNAVSTTVITNSLIAGNAIVGNSVGVTGNISANFFRGNGANIALPGLLMNFVPDVANQAARLALTGPNGTVVLQTDTSVRYILTQQPPSVNANWLVFTGSSFTTVSVFGRTGAVVAQVGDYVDSQVSISNPIGPIPTSGYLSDALAYLDASKANVVNGDVYASVFAGNVVSPGNVDASNVTTSLMRTNGNVIVSRTMNIVGNIVANYIYGDGTFVTGVVENVSNTANIDIFGNVAAPGNVIALGQIRVLGNVVASTFIGNVISNLTNTTILVANTVTIHTGNIVVAGNVIANVINANVFTTRANIVANLFGNGIVARGNVDATNVTTTTLNVNGNMIVAGNSVKGDMVVFGNSFVQINSTLSNNVVMSSLSNVSVSNSSFVPLAIDIRSNVVHKTSPATAVFSPQTTAVGLEGTMVLKNGTLYRCGIGYGNSANQVFGYAPWNNYILKPVTMLGGPNEKVIDFKYTSFNAIALTSSGNVWAWGANYASIVPTRVNLPGPVARIYAPTTRALSETFGNGMTQYAAVLSNGQMYMWGLNDSYQLGDNTNVSKNTPVIPTFLSVANIIHVDLSATWAGSTLAVESGGTMYVWGNNSVGQLGVGNTATIRIPILSTISISSPVTDAKFGGSWYSYFAPNNRTSLRVLLANGTSFATGYNGNGELGIGNTNNSTTFIRESTNRSNIAAIGTITATANNAHYLVQSDGQIFFAGFPRLFGTNSAVSQTTFIAGVGGFQRNMLANVGTPVTTPRVKSAFSFSSTFQANGFATTAVLDNTGNLYGCGYNGQGIFGNGITTGALFPLTLLNQFFPGNARAVDFTMLGWVNESGGIVAGLQDGTMIATGNARQGSIPVSLVSSPNSIPFWSYVPSFGPLNV
jgi:alpha-tubulin suppressor-like RCC1 family protein/cytoskeletal protein CcmA (bactofilin family)